MRPASSGPVLYVSRPSRVEKVDQVNVLHGKSVVTTQRSSRAKTNAIADVLHRQSSEDSKLRAIYAHLYTPFEVEDIAIMLGVHRSSIYGWVEQFKENWRNQKL
eukprot:TRINITY_DN12309_c0_g1_i1.p2 TRINITY_DN12309_c0_g1~~TRINITY_DN12309_c0_g1_i1.p2  ORF type:complete len:111 (-),score=11.53 TRINITY_DN12309_c0_g1_i1:455-766(-)